MDTADLNRPEIIAEVQAQFTAYEEALLGNDLSELDRLFWDSPVTVRYGIAEHAVGIAAVRAARAGLSPVHPQRQLMNTVITTFGRDAAAVCTEFTNPDSALIGRQTQTWIRLPAGWRIVAAHVSTVTREALIHY